MLVWYEAYDSMESAIAREKAIKGWKRAWKLEIIEKSNSTWRDLHVKVAQLESEFRRNDEDWELAFYF